MVNSSFSCSSVHSQYVILARKFNKFVSLFIGSLMWLCAFHICDLWWQCKTKRCDQKMPYFTSKTKEGVQKCHFLQARQKGVIKSCLFCLAIKKWHVQKCLFILLEKRCVQKKPFLHALETAFRSLIFICCKKHAILLWQKDNRMRSIQQQHQQTCLLLIPTQNISLWQQISWT